MDRPYGTAVLEPIEVPAWDGYAMEDAGDGHGTLAEKVYVVLLGLCGAAAYLLYKTGYTYAGLGVMGAPFLIGWLFEPRIGIYAYCFWQVWDAAIVLGDDRGAWLTPAKILAFGVLGIGALHVWRRPFKLTASRSTVVWAGLLTFMALLSAIWSYDQFRSLRLGSQFLVQLIMLLLMVAMVGGNVGHVKRLMFWSVLGGATAAIYLILFGTAQQAYTRATLSEDANPNTTAAGLIVAMGGLALLWSLTRSKITRFLLVGAFILMLVAVVQTGSRAALGGLIGALGATAVLAGGEGRAKRFVLMGIALVGTYIIGAIVVYSTLVPEKTAVRLAELMMLPSPQGYSGSMSGDHLTASRRMVWGLAMEGYQRNPILGAGIGCSVYASGTATGFYKDVHSNVLGSLVDMGPLGLFVFMGLNVAMALAVLKLRDPALKGPAWIILLSTFAVGATHTTYTTKWFWLPITFLAIIYELDVYRSPDRESYAFDDLDAWDYRWSRQEPR